MRIEYRLREPDSAPLRYLQIGPEVEIQWRKSANDGSKTSCALPAYCTGREAWYLLVSTEKKIVSFETL